MTEKKIVVLGTGGTLAGRAGSGSDNLGYTAAQVGVGELLAAIPALKDVPITSEQVAQIDSKDMDAAVWSALAQRAAYWLARDDVRGLVVTHGTDTLEETAYFLQALLAPAKPVVVTGAMRPATSCVADGPQNVADAVTVAMADGARGVVAVLAGTIHGAADVMKMHTYRPSTFGSGDAGPLGYVEEGRLRLLRPWPQGGLPGARPAFEQIAAGAPWPRVEIVLSHAGASGAVVRALVEQGVDGLVAAGTGNGTLHRALEEALLQAEAAGVRVVRASRCPEGRLLEHGGDRLPAAAAASPVKARIALLLELLAGRSG